MGSTPIRRNFAASIGYHRRMLADRGATEREALEKAPTLGARPDADEIEIGVAEARIGRYRCHGEFACC